MNNTNKKTKNMILCALFAALTGVLSQISIPLPFTPVPVNLATLSACLAGGLIGAKRGAISQVVYVALGFVGIPVFAGFSSGFRIIIGPTGGYILGYIIAAFIVGLFIDKMGDKISICIISMILGILGCYIFGTIWFMWVMKTGLMESLLMCVVPFLIGDVLKIVASTFLVRKLKRFV